MVACTTVQIYLDDFDDDAIIQEIKSRGYKVGDDVDLKISYSIEKLYSHYSTCNPETFNKELKMFFMSNMKNVYLK